MGKKVRSARGVILDLDLMKIKEQIASAPTPLEVKARQNFIESRLKRRLKKAQAAVAVESTNVETEPTMPEPSTATVKAETEHIEDAVQAQTEPPAPPKKKKSTKQKARPTKKKE